MRTVVRLGRLHKGSSEKARWPARCMLMLEGSMNRGEIKKKKLDNKRQTL